MSDLDELRRLSDKATPGPWIRRWASLDVHHMSGDDALTAQRDIDFAVAATSYVRSILESEPPTDFGTQWEAHNGPLPRSLKRRLRTPPPVPGEGE